MDATMDIPRERAFRPEMADRLGTETRTPGWDLATERRIDDGDALAHGLGLFSLALGAAEVLFPRKLGEALGVEDYDRVIRTMGFREIGHGVAILAKGRRPAGPVWSRVFGDVLDLAALGAALTGGNPKKRNVWLAIGAVAGVTVLDLLCAKQLSAAKNERFRH